MQLGNFIDVFIARDVSGTYAHHQEHYMLSCSYGFLQFKGICKQHENEYVYIYTGTSTC